MGKLIENQGYIGNFAENPGTNHCRFTVCNKDGASVNFSGSPTSAVYRGDSTVESTNSLDILITNEITGFYEASFNLDRDFYLPGYDYNVMIRNATVDSETVSAVLFSFSVDNRT